MTRTMFIALLALSGCSVLQPLSPEEAVTRRAEAQADALLARDYDKALSFVNPAYQQSPKAALYKGKHAGTQWWTKVEVREVRCDDVPEPERCRVRLFIYANMPRAGTYAGQLGDDVPTSTYVPWIKVDGKWYEYKE